MSRERAQPIRPTQFITTYGPGAILDTLRGPRLIYSLADSTLFGESSSPVEYEIKEPALQQMLPEHSRIFRLPSNADRGLEDNVAMYQTAAFPMWSLCTVHSVLYRSKYPSRKACPRCPATSEGAAWEQAREQAVSFVQACPEGHLDEVSWSYLLHKESGRADCQPEFIEWHGSGGPLRGVRLVCPGCKASVGFGDLYHRDHTCRGRFPEHRGAVPAGCSASARISQRAASDLYLPEVRTALTLPQVDSDLHRALRHDSVFSQLELMSRMVPTLGEEHWAMALTGARVPTEIREQIERASLEQRGEALKRVLDESVSLTESEARGLELRALLDSGPTGRPRTANFELDAQGAREFSLGPMRLKVTPVNRLRMVAAQVGYRRLNGTVVECGLQHGSQTWFPGVEQFGEGLFLELVTPPRDTGPAWNAWRTRAEGTGEDSDAPLLVWWHTLSHRLIRALSVDSGYSAASVRERLYYDGERGGLLIYAVQPGGDGTLGGLVALVPRFDRILASALEGLETCSNDPLCGDQAVSASRQSGATCYACCLLSETSCEMRNLSLDRRVLLETLF